MGGYLRYNDFMEKDSILHRLEERMKAHHLPFMPVIWGVTFVIIAGLVAIGIYHYYSVEKAMARQFNTQQLILAQQAAQGIENFLANIRETAMLLTQSPESPSPPGEEETLRHFYQNFQGRIYFLFQANSQGKITAAYPSETMKGMLGENFNPQPSFEKVRQTRETAVHLFLPPKKDLASPNPGRSGVVLITLPILRDSGLAGFLSCGLDFAQIRERYITPIRSGVTGGAWMISPEGIFIAHYEGDLVGKDAFKARKEKNPGIRTEAIDQIMEKEMLQGKSGMAEYVSGWHRGQKGTIKKLIAYAPVRLDMQVGSLAVVAPYSEVTQQVWGSFKNSVLLLFLMAGILLAGTYVGHKINQERIRAEEKVKWGEEILKSQNRLQALFDGAPDAMVIVDRNYRISAVNQATLNWYKKPLEEFCGKVCHQEFQDRSDLCPNCPAEETFRTNLPAFREKGSLIADGTKHYLQIFTFPLHNQGGEAVEVVEYVKDVTAQKQLQQQIIQSERLAVVGRMSATVAHEIKNPLGTIVLNAELLGEELERFAGQDTTEARSMLNVIKAELDRLIEVVEEYLQFARLPKVRLEMGQVNEVLADLLDFLKEETADRKVMVVQELGGPLPLIPIDAKQIRQAFLNIIKNSFEAMPGGGKQTISTFLKDGQVEITIGDTGRGISEENKDLIFTPFFSTRHGGTGLGLPITAHIIQEHRGTIRFESYLDLGTIFHIRLPAQPFSDTALSNGKSLTAGSSPGS